MEDIYMAKVKFWENPQFAGRGAEYSTNQSSLPDWENQGAGSLIVEADSDSEWTVLWEYQNQEGKGDSLWIQGSGRLEDLSHVARPHGDNKWWRKISSISFHDAPPIGDNENRTILRHGDRNYQDGNHGTVTLDGFNPTWDKKAA
jgi:hypothetical protein